MKTIQLSLCGTALLLLTACGSSKNVQFLEAYAPQESSLNMVKITDESNNSVTAGSSSYINKYQVQSSIKSPVGVCAKSMYRWFTHKTLAISPDGTLLAVTSQGREGHGGNALNLVKVIRPYYGTPVPAMTDSIADDTDDSPALQETPGDVDTDRKSGSVNIIRNMPFWIGTGISLIAILSLLLYFIFRKRK